MTVRDWREAFERELRRAFSDPATPWRELLFNGLYEVCELDTDAEARSHAARLLWEVAFPTEPLPSAPAT
jgi:hypothetical protein